jgi:hypothetical protein
MVILQPATIASQDTPDLGPAPAPPSHQPDHGAIRTPSTPCQAYVVGMQASRRGDDLANVVNTALFTWEMDVGLHAFSELIASAAIGWLTTEWRKEFMSTAVEARPAQPENNDLGAPWRNRADELARWTGQRLVNRSDCYGGYYLDKAGIELTPKRIIRHFRARSVDDVIGLHGAARIIISEGLD